MTRASDRNDIESSLSRDDLAEARVAAGRIPEAKAIFAALEIAPSFERRLAVLCRLLRPVWVLLYARSQGDAGWPEPSGISQRT
jgi:hypothetical protein